MAQKDYSIGSVYFSFPRLKCWWCLPHTVDIVEIGEPWRRGKGKLFCIVPFFGLIIGRWHPDKDAYYADLDSARKEPLGIETTSEVISKWKAVGAKKKQKLTTH